MIDSLLRHFRLGAMIFRYGRLDPAGRDFNCERQRRLQDLEAFVPAEYAGRNRMLTTRHEWLPESPRLKNALIQLAYLRRVLTSPRGHLTLPAQALHYIRIPKAASTSISKAMLEARYSDLKERALDGVALNYLADANTTTMIPAKKNTFFAAVRNPFARLVSVYKQFFEGDLSLPHHYADYLFGTLTGDLPFGEFVRRIDAIPDRLKDQHFMPQHLLLEYYKKRGLDVVVKKMEEPGALQVFLRQYGLDLPRMNEHTVAYDYRLYYDVTSFKTVSAAYKKDVALFGYEQEKAMLEEYIRHRRQKNIRI